MSSSSSSIEDECSADLDHKYDLPMHIVALFIIMGCSLAGTTLPIMLKKFPATKKYGTLFACGKMFGSGVILATALVHMLIPADQNLTSPCLPPLFTETYSAFAGAFCLAAILCIHLLQLLIGLQLEKSEGTEVEPLKAMHDHHGHGGHGHTHGHGISLSNKAHKVSVYILELGIASHSVIIGITLGVTRDPEFKPLMVALVFHQFFEGMALSTVVLDAQFSNYSASLFMVAFYTLTTPGGIGIGIAISDSFNANSHSTLLIQGILDSVSAGILLYDGLVNIIAPHFQTEEFKKKSGISQAMQIFCLWTGAGVMALVGRWA